MAQDGPKEDVYEDSISSKVRPQLFISMKCFDLGMASAVLQSISCLAVL